MPVLSIDEMKELICHDFCGLYIRDNMRVKHALHNAYAERGPPDDPHYFTYRDYLYDEFARICDGLQHGESIVALMFRAEGWSAEMMRVNAGWQFAVKCHPRF